PRSSSPPALRPFPTTTLFRSTAVKLVAGSVRALERPRAPASGARGAILGFFAGGTLRDEARRLVGDAPPHRFVDFGGEEYTRGQIGRAHVLTPVTVRSRMPSS